jgi:outer membrane protein assembly factor BamA
LKTFKYLFIIAAILSFFKAFSQQDHPGHQITGINNSKLAAAIDSSRQKDLIDVIQTILDKSASPEKRKLPKKANYSIIPYAGYTLSTGFTADISGNVGFYTSTSHHENLSILAADLAYDSKSQKIFLTRSEIWANENSYKIISDMRWERFPTDTYGLGTFTTFAKDNDVNFNYVRLYETVLKKIADDYYAGIGYNFDYHYDIEAFGNLDNTVSDFMKYGQTVHSTSSGIDLNFLYDNRKNPLNPLSGTYANVIFRENLTALGSNASWRSLQFDFRRYIKLSSQSNNVLALWSIMAFTSGNVPYLDLPATGSDMYNNSGRGYAMGRFRGRNMLYLEAEYRFGITCNGLLGAVIFANSESFSELQGNAFEKMAPAAGTGIRIKINKHSNSNICIDYAAGTGGSHGFFVNLGEVF